MHADFSKSIIWMTLLGFFLAGSGLALAGNGDGTLNDYETIALGDCLIGNLNPPVGPPVPGIFTGNESYAYWVFPENQCTSPEDGFILESITQLLHFEVDQVPATLIVKPSLLEALYDSQMDCWIPGASLYDGPEVTIIITDNGVVAIQLPTPGAPSLVRANNYFLALHYQGNAVGQLVVDDDPQSCIEFINRGTGWEDLFGRKRSGGGKVIIFGDIIFAPASVENTPTTWDGIKSLYK